MITTVRNINLIPYFPLVSALCTGILTEFVFHANGNLAIEIVLLSIIGILIFTLFHIKSLLYSLLLILIFNVGFWRLYFFDKPHLPVEKEVFIEGVTQMEKGHLVFSTQIAGKELRYLVLPPVNHKLKQSQQVSLRIIVLKSLPEPNPGNSSWKRLQLQLNCNACIRITQIIRSKKTTSRIKNYSHQGLHHFLQKSYQKPLNGLLYALMTGDRREIPSIVKSQFQDTGLSHVLALSGFHISLYFLILLALPFPKTLGNLFKPVVVTTVIISYLYYTSFPSSLVRASVMGLVWLWCHFLQVRVHLLHPVFFAAFLILLIQPVQLFSLGFILSFGAVLGILIYLPLFLKGINQIIFLRQPVIKIFLGFIALPITAQILTSPVILETFHYLTFGSLISNLLIYPFIFPILILSWLSYGLSVIHINVTFLINTVHFLYFLFIKLNASLIMMSKQFSITSLSPNGFWLYYLLLTSLTGGILWPIRKLYWSLSTGLIILLTYFTGNQIFYLLNTGQAQSLLINCARPVLVDAGKDRFAFSRRYDIQRILQALNIQNLYAIFVSHLDYDHYGQLFRILRANPNTKIFLPRTALYETRKLIRFLQKVKDPGNVKFLTEGIQIKLSSQLQVRCIYPDTSTVIGGNSGSMVLLVKSRAQTLVYPGDLPGDILSTLPTPDTLDVLIAPHHGATNGILPEFIREKTIHEVWISCGFRNRYGHPAQGVLNQLRKNKITIQRTDLNGCIKK